MCSRATASVDLASDERVHAVLLALPCTVLMVCHRLQHVPRFDLVATVSRGRVVELGEPTALLRDPASRFSRLAARAGLTAASTGDNCH